VKSPKWLTTAMVVAIHDEAIYTFGGLGGIRDRGLLEGALGRPRNTGAYTASATIFDLAASLGVGIARDHAFVDGNKRTALLATRAFLFLNGHTFEPDEHDEVMTMLRVATGELAQDAFALRLQKNCVTRPRTRGANARSSRSKRSRKN